MSEQWVIFVPLLPLLAGLWVAIGYILGVNRGEPGERQTSLVCLSAIGISVLLLLILDAAALLHGVTGQVKLAQWFSSGAYAIEISFTLDALGLSIATVVALVALFTTKFSINYMHRETGYQRFFIVLCLFSSAMLLIVLAGNPVLMFVGWELAGVSSYLLIAFSFERPTAVDNASRAFITNRIGDAGFILSIFFAYLWIADIDWPNLAQVSDHLSTLQVALLASGFFIAAFAKSAMLPFSAWITRALEGPTPSSAIFYGSLMVHAGVFLLLRLQPLIEHVVILQIILVVIGASTTLYGFLGGLVQADVKTALIFSTTGHIGLMAVSCGLGWFDLAAWHLAGHAIWRAYQFLSAPAFMHMIDRPARPVPDWLLKRRWLYAACVQRFWLDNISNGLLVRPTINLAREVEFFDEQVVNRIVGLPSHIGAASSLAEWEERKQGLLNAPEGGVVRAQGVLGKFMDWVAVLLHWFEERLVLQGGDQGLIKLFHYIGRYLQTVEQLLSQPRYLWLLILITFVVII